MNKICTSPEQSKKLIELEIDANTADMRYQYVGSSFKDGITKPVYFLMVMRNDLTEKDIPAWSLTALLGLMPPGNILLRDALNGKYKCINSVDSSYYDNPVDTCVEMIVKLKKLELL